MLDKRELYANIEAWAVNIITFTAASIPALFMGALASMAVQPGYGMKAFYIAFILSWFMFIPKFIIDGYEMIMICNIVLMAMSLVFIFKVILPFAMPLLTRYGVLVV